jgi:hypothetical protein
MNRIRFTLESVDAPSAMITSPRRTSGATAPQLPTRIMAFTPYSRTNSVA